MTDLTDAEKALIEDKSPGDDETAGWEYALLHRTVETILTDRLAAVTARAEAAEAEAEGSAWRLERERESNTRLRMRAEAAEAKIARVVKVHDEYFDTDREPFDDASPEPEDVWRYDRDLRAALADEGDTHE